MIEGIIAVMGFVFIGLACAFLGFGWLAAGKRYKSENAILKQDNELLKKRCKKLIAKNQFLKNELKNKN